MYDLYQITYHHDDQPDVTQEKYLVPHELWVADGGLHKKIPKRVLVFTDKSPMFDAMSTGYLDAYGGLVRVSFVKVGTGW